MTRAEREADSPRRVLRLLLLLPLALAAGACSLIELAGYVVSPDAPELEGGEELVFDGLRAPVEVALRSDGLWRIEAADERDAMFAVGYLQARDRMAQLDIFRHLARGELAALLGNRRMGEKSALETDLLNRFLGFRDAADHLYRATSNEERDALGAFVRGVNAWIDEGRLSLEHRLLGVDHLRPWTPRDSLAIYAFVMHALSGNADREIRRLRIACAAGLEALERVWPNDIEFETVAMPEEALRSERYPPQPAVAPELAEALPELCERAHAAAPAPRPPAPVSVRGDLPDATQLARVARWLGEGLAASNNWAVSGALSRSGAPIFSTDPHLPHMNPPMLWGVELVLRPAEPEPTDEAQLHVAGFTLPGLHRVVFGHNGRVAFGATTNHVDRQDLVIHKERTLERGGERTPGYEVDGAFVPFAWREERFEVRGGEPFTARVRFTRDGPLLNDLEPVLAGGLPLTALRRPPPGPDRDLDGARAINRARSAAEFAAGIALLDRGCSSWVFADVAGHLGYRSPCRVPVRQGWRGTFPVPGWLSRYDARGVYAKSALPALDDPARGWIATANNQIIPSWSFPSAYNNDASSPNRFLRIRQALLRAQEAGGLSAEASAAIQLDARYQHWPRLAAEIGPSFCREGRKGGEEGLGGSGATGDVPLEALVAEAWRRLCTWNGEMGARSVEATLYTLLTHALLDRALADELPGERGRSAWRAAQSLLQFEADVAWLWSRPEAAPVWDDIGSPRVERRSDILRAALSDAVAEGRARWGDDLSSWRWGEVRPFSLRHFFTGSGGGILGAIFDSAPLALPGGTETPFKQQFPRSDREHMHPAVGPVARITVDMADPWSATYTFAGGESGWPLSRRYANLLEDWGSGRGRPLTPSPSKDALRVRLIPAPARGSPNPDHE